jgi:hypothetical protein
MPAKTLASHQKHATGFDHRAFEGEGDAFMRKRFKETHTCRRLNITLENSEGPILMREGDIFGELVRINRSFSSSGLNLTGEGLLLGMQKGGHKETPTKLHLTRRTFVSITIANTSIDVAGRNDLAQRRRPRDLGWRSGLEQK